MDILHLFENLKSNYKDYIGSFANIKDSRIEDVVNQSIQEEKVWPKALVQFNPFFEQGIGVTEMIAKGLPIHPELELFSRIIFTSINKRQLSSAVKEKSL